MLHNIYIYHIYVYHIYIYYKNIIIIIVSNLYWLELLVAKGDIEVEKLDPELTCGL